MRFVIDAQLPPALAAVLQREGHDAVAVRDIGLREASDGDIWGHCAQTGQVIVSKDDDFARRARDTTTGPSVVWLRVGNASKRALEAWFVPLLPAILDQLDAGERLVEVR
ncbi:MAG: DUF5615 family PIN-like protein [Microbacterium sp.]|uniref:DUF5615 family PIN-like protein n=1 Tax=Microbacterium sp. TaxID=51671 RepID=UPI0039E3FD92